MEKDQVTRDILRHIHSGETSHIDKFIRSNKVKQNTKAVLLNELTITPLLESVFSGNVLIFKLLQCEIHSITPAHFAALMGQTEILVSFCEYLDADCTLESGSTMLHMASFGGNMGTVKLLLDVYRCNPIARDKYGWTALHYASTEGHVHVVKSLVSHGVDINVRDKDGTCAALRAKWHGHENLVNFFCNIGDEDFLLNIDVDDVQVDPPYAKVHKPGTKPATPETTAAASFQHPRRASNAVDGGKSNTSSKKKPMDKFSTLPAKFKQKDHEAVRRIIRENLEVAFSDYEIPVGQAMGQGVLGQEGLQGTGVGMNTMTKIMREELQKLKDNILSPQSPGGGRFPVQTENYYVDDEDPYMTLGNAPPIPSATNSGGSKNSASSASPAPVPPPPLPPRNPGMKTNGQADDDEGDIDGHDYVRVDPRARINPVTKQMPVTAPTSAALDAATGKLARVLGNDWKKLARALPIDTDKRRLEARIKNIEKQHLGNVDSQAEASLVEWRIHAGEEADVDALILALRSCGFHDKIDAVERATQEFTA